MFCATSCVLFSVGKTGADVEELPGLT